MKVFDGAKMRTIRKEAKLTQYDLAPMVGISQDRLKQLQKLLSGEFVMKFELINDHFENAKRYNIPRAQLIIADIPYNLGNNAYASDPRWYENGDNKTVRVSWLENRF